MDSKQVKRRWRDWWHAYAGSVAFVLLVAVTARWTWVDHQRLTRLEENEANVHEVQQNIIYDRAQALEKQAQVIAKELSDSLARQRELTENLSRRQAAISRLSVDIIRKANIDGCRRDNLIRARLRTYAREQLEVSVNLTRKAIMPDKSTEDFLRIMAGAELALQHLDRDLVPINCKVVYPPPDYQFPLEPEK